MPPQFLTFSRPDIQEIFDIPKPKREEITKHPSFCSTIKCKEDAVSMLQQYGGNCHVTSSWTLRGKEVYVLSTAQRKQGQVDTKHFRLEITDKKCRVMGEDSKTFGSISELLSHYYINPITDGFESIGDPLEFDSNHRLIQKLTCECFIKCK